MKFEIHNRWSGNVQFTAEIEADENTPFRIKVGLALKWGAENKAVLRDADLRDADLRDADLRDADLRDADLRDADLRDADLRGADLRDADLRGADLRGAVLRGVPKIENLDTQILAAIEAGGHLEMGSWHGSGGTCGTTHCRAGWAIHLAGEEGKKLEDEFGPAGAGALLYAKAYPELRIPSFYTDNATALADIKARAELDKTAA